MTLDFLGHLQRSHVCGDLRSLHAGETVTLMGWVNRRRDHGDLIFFDLRDRSGVTQVVFDKSISAEAHARAEAARPEYVVAVTGTVRLREPGMANPKMATGDIEVVGRTLLLLNDARTPPFSPAEDAIANEELRLKYRYLDLRRPEMQRNFALRSRVAMAIRNYLVEQGFLEIETPYMTRSTPEGARDYLVPSRVHPGEFFALPQSPQIFKQILMISGFDRYFQIARCFRDEDLRADRQPEFTQIDLEMTFPQQEAIFAVAEGFLRAAFGAAGIVLGAKPFLHMTYDQAIERYGIDKPDMRLPAMVNLSDAFDDKVRAKLKVAQGLPILGFSIPRVGTMSTTAKKALLNEIRNSLGDAELDVLDVSRMFSNEDLRDTAYAVEKLLLDEVAKFFGGYLKERPSAYPRSQALPDLSEETMISVVDPYGTAPLNIVITPKVGSADEKQIVFDRITGKSELPVRQGIAKRVGQLRLELARKFADKHRLFEPTGPEGQPSPRDFRFLWVTDFPMYEWNEDAKRWDAAHHPFTSPHEEDIQSGALYNDKGAVRALAYDVVLNGTELGSGSIRIHRKDVQTEIFRTLGMTDSEAHERFGFFLDALEYGTPPHGGIALGLDRIVMILAGATSLREVIAFPKTARAIDLMVEAPSPVSDLQLRELNLRIAHRP